MFCLFLRQAVFVTLYFISLRTSHMHNTQKPIRFLLRFVLLVKQYSYILSTLRYINSDMVFELNTIRNKILARKGESCRMVYKIMFVCIWERNTYSISIPAYLRNGRPMPNSRRLTPYSLLVINKCQDSLLGVLAFYYKQLSVSVPDNRRKRDNPHSLSDSNCAIRVDLGRLSGFDFSDCHSPYSRIFKKKRYVSEFFTQCIERGHRFFVNSMINMKLFVYSHLLRSI